MKIALTEACQLLKSGAVVAVPTETVYGLAATLTQPAAIDQIFALKGRPSNNPLIIHLANFNQIAEYVTDLPQGTEQLANAFWPGPLTLVLPCHPKISSRVRAGLPTAAFRVPNHSLTQQLLQLTGPLVMPSANISGRPSSTRRDHVENDFGVDFPVLEGKEVGCPHGVESTILHHNGTQWQVIRLGALSAECLASALGYVPEVVIETKGHSPLCPGQLYRHYAPRARLQLCLEEIESSPGVVVGYSDRHYAEASRVIVLGPVSRPEIVAENLYGVLRRLDLEGVVSACVDMRFPRVGLWVTLEERLRKASSS